MKTTIVACLAILSVVSEKSYANTTAEFISKAHQYDNMYNLGPEASQQKALNLYQQALDKSPTDEQKLHILYRMAQLNGSSYRLDKGEKPNFTRAIELYKQIVKEFSSDNPLVFKAMVSIGDHYTTMRQFDSAIEWYKKALEYDIRIMEQEVKEIEKQRDSFISNPEVKEAYSEEDIERQRTRFKQASTLRKAVEKIKRYQEIAVVQVGYAAEHIDPLIAHGELRALEQKYAGTFIAERARECLVKNMDRYADIWAPKQDDPYSPDQAFSAANHSSVANVKRTSTDLYAPSVEVITDGISFEKKQFSDSDKLKQNEKIIRQSRGPPLVSIPIISFSVASLLFAGSIVVIIYRKRTKGELNHENS